MLKFVWNALRVGDHVVVHDPERADMALVPGVVAMIDVHTARRGTNGVGIRIAGGTAANRVRWPVHLAVHEDPNEPPESCWRCEESAERVRQQA